MITARARQVAFSVLFFSGVTASYAQPPGLHPPAEPVQFGDVFINAGAGLGESYLGSYGTPSGFKAAVNWGVAEAGPGVITLGASFGASFSHGQTSLSDQSSSNSLVFMIRDAWHYGWEIPGLDLSAYLLQDGSCNIADPCRL